jgi:hypothetical protein
LKGLLCLIFFSAITFAGVEKNFVDVSLKSGIQFDFTGNIRESSSVNMILDGNIAIQGKNVLFVINMSGWEMKMLKIETNVYMIDDKQKTFIKCQQVKASIRRYKLFSI